MIMPFMNRGLLLPLQWVYWLFLFFPYILTRISSTMFNRNYESWQPCLVHNLTEKILILQSLSMTYAAGFLQIHFIKLSYTEAFFPFGSLTQSWCCLFPMYLLETIKGPGPEAFSAPTHAAATLSYNPQCFWIPSQDQVRWWLGCLYLIEL